MDFPHGVKVTLRSVTTTTDTYGNSTTSATTRSWGPVAVAPRYATEQNDTHAPAIVVGLTFYGPKATIDSDDVIVLSGEEWQVDGLPENYTGAGRNPFTGWEPGMVVQTKRAP